MDESIFLAASTARYADISDEPNRFVPGQIRFSLFLSPSPFAPDETEVETAQA